MILLDLIKLKLRMPSTARFFANAGLAAAFVGVVATLFAIPFPFPPFLLIGLGMLIRWAGRRRLETIGRASR